MSQTMTGTNTTDPTTTPTATVPADGDAANAASVNGAFQSLLNAIGWLRVQIAALVAKTAGSAMWTSTATITAGNVPAGSYATYTVSVPSAKAGDVVVCQQQGYSITVIATCLVDGSVDVTYVNNNPSAPSTPASPWTARMFGFRG